MKMSDRKRLAELRFQLAKQGGRGVDLAEEIDDLACELGECGYTAAECDRATHQGKA